MPNFIERNELFTFYRRRFSNTKMHVPVNVLHSSHVGMPHTILFVQMFEQMTYTGLQRISVLSFQQMLVGYIHYDSKAFNHAAFCQYLG